MSQLTATFTGKVVARFKRKARDLEIATLVIECIDGNPMYPQYIKTEWLKDKADLVTPFPVGSEVTATVNIRGRKWISPENKTQYFNSFAGWKIEAANQTSQPAPVQDAVVVSQDGEDDLPF